MPMWPIAGGRILIGLLWLISLRWKLPPEFTPASGRGLLDWLELEVRHAAFPFYGEFIAATVIPNFIFFAWLVFLAELLVGTSLVAGIFTRLGAAVGLLMSINLGIGLLEVPGEWPWSYIMLAMWHFVFLIAGAGRLWGLDGRLRAAGADSWWARWIT